MTHFTWFHGPTPAQRPTAVLHYEREQFRALGELPLQHMRLQLSGVARIRPYDRIATLFAIDQLCRAGGSLHWRDVEFAWRHNRLQQGRRVWSDEEFWDRLALALHVGVLTCKWDASWPVAA